jgi:hypothetical protein
MIMHKYAVYSITRPQSERINQNVKRYEMITEVQNIGEDQNLI